MYQAWRRIASGDVELTSKHHTRSVGEYIQCTSTWRRKAPQKGYTSAISRHPKVIGTQEGKMSDAWRRKAPEHAIVVSIPCTICPIPYPEEIEIQLTAGSSDSSRCQNMNPLKSHHQLVYLPCKPEWSCAREYTVHCVKRVKHHYHTASHAESIPVGHLPLVATMRHHGHAQLSALESSTKDSNCSCLRTQLSLRDAKWKPLFTTFAKHSPVNENPGDLVGTVVLSSSTARTARFPHEKSVKGHSLVSSCPCSAKVLAFSLPRIPTCDAT